MRRVLNLTFVGIWAIWIGGAAFGYISVGSGPKGVASLPAKALQQGAVVLPKAIAAPAATAPTATATAGPIPTILPESAAPLIAKNVRDCTAVTPIEKSAGTACDAHAPQGPSMAPAVFHSLTDK
jgi:hypothetical protein